MKVHILVLNYNGKHLLERFLPSIIRAAKNSEHQCRIMVVDNCSIDASVEFIREHFPSVEVFVSKKNEVNCSHNQALKTIESDIVILLNNDIEVKEDFIDYLVEHFKDKDVFFAAPRLLNFDDTYNGGRSHLYFDFGILKNKVDLDNAGLPGSTHSIGTGAFCRKDFLRFGGFNRLYLPGIWEDVDICYRALLRGKKGIYEPRSIIWHQESTTFNKEYGKRKRLIIAHRNMFLFLWTNLGDISLIFRHLFFLPFRLLYSVFSRKNELAIGFILALPRLHLALLRRFQDSRNLAEKKLKDKDIIR